MASLYKRNGKWWLRYKQDGVWKGKPTEYSVSNSRETKVAIALCNRRTKEELMLKADNSDSRWDYWVPRWLEAKFGHLSNSTPATYRVCWRHLSKWLQEIGVDRPSRLTRQQCVSYIQWRANHRGSRNTALYELRFLAQICDEAIYAKLCDSNPCRKLGIAQEEQKHKTPWTDHQIQVVGQALQKDWGSWLHVTFLMGLYQAARLRQAELPLNAFDFTHDVIYYPMEKVKGGKFFAQPIDLRVRDTLFQLCSERISNGEQVICKIPPFPSLKWRTFLDGFGFSNISHHGLRVTWATRACLAGVPMAQAMKFCNHSTELIHRVYQQLSVGDLKNVPSLVAFPSF